MKIAYTSDLHTDYSTRNAELVPYLSERIAEIAPEIFVLAGDIATQRGIFAETLAKFSDLTCVKLLVPGNHDIWIESKRQLRRGIDSSRKYYDLLPEICEDHGFIPIWIRPHIVDDIGFIGSIGWYDYSFRNRKFDDRITTQMYAGGTYGRGTWVDSIRAWWLRKPMDKRHRPVRNRLCKTDGEVCSEMVESLRRDCRELSNNSIRRIAAVIHHLPFMKMVRHTDDLSRDFFSAFVGSDKMGAALLEDSRVSHVICGHLHRKRTHRINGIQAVSSPIGYHDEWQSSDYRTVASDCIEVLVAE